MFLLSRCRIWIVVIFVVVIVSGNVADAAQPNLLQRELVEAGWIELFDGETLAGWQRTGEAEWTVVDGTVVTKGEKPGWLMTTSEWTNFELHVEFQSPAATNINGADLDEKRFWNIYARTEELGWTMYLHPVDTIGRERTTRYYLKNLLGVPGGITRPSQDMNSMPGTLSATVGACGISG